MAGIQREVIMKASGHASVEMHDRYVNVKEHHLTSAFAEFFKMQTTCRHEKETEGDEAVNA